MRKMKKAKSLNIKGKLVTLDEPWIMGILNVTPDSFYAASRVEEESEIYKRIETILLEGGRIVDIGGCSTRPGAYIPTEEEERERLEGVLSILMHHYPGVIVSVDTFRANIARWAVEEYGASIINDVSGGDMDPEMFRTIADLRIPYIIMHMRGTPETMQSMTTYENVTAEVLQSLATKMDQLYQLGVNDVIVDPGFGFSKTVAQNYELMRHLSDFRILEAPLLVGVSRKKMVYETLETTPENSLNGTTVLNAFSLLQGADILRVHDVRAAVEAVRITQLLKEE
ncbi:dihydropteroate synthase [Parabacteroides sp. An277]|uniref:dihydropteroate synthase n=1 Tax=Parabacteroides sp. An277 TaxID=1965619 RepID=UPI000B3AD07B|nr:dihydropteroate synthase [Parabacteroides sp. An277]OUO52718.1 dihydropteroate synthase [Parabacteroides sp. An277]